MKFASLQDKKIFMVELGEIDHLDKITDEFKPSDEMIELLIKRRKKLFGQLRDFRKSQNTKAQWRKNRYKLMKGIKTFHKSTAGKKFHRSLGRFLATRDNYTSGSLLGTREGLSETLKALSSVKTHGYIEIEYYHSLNEEIEYWIFMEEMIPVIDRIEKHVLSKQTEKIEEDDWEFLIRLTESAALVKSFAEKSGKTIEVVEKMWNEIKSALIKDGKDEGDPRFYGLVVDILKKKLGVK